MLELSRRMMLITGCCYDCVCRYFASHLGNGF